MRETNFMARTQNHIDRVKELLTVFELRINKRARNHDQSKLSDPEQKLFQKYEDKLFEITYNSEEYWELMEKIKPALEHHYKENRHHPIISKTELRT